MRQQELEKEIKKLKIENLQLKEVLSTILHECVDVFSSDFNYYPDQDEVDKSDIATLTGE